SPFKNKTSYLTCISTHIHNVTHIHPSRVIKVVYVLYMYTKSCSHISNSYTRSRSKSHGRMPQSKVIIGISHTSPIKREVDFCCISWDLNIAISMYNRG